MNIKVSGKRPREETLIRRSKRARKTPITEASAPLHFACKTLNYPSVIQILYSKSPQERLNLLFSETVNEASALDVLPAENIKIGNQIKERIAKQIYSDIDKQFETFEALSEQYPSITSRFGIDKTQFTLFKRELTITEISNISTDETVKANAFGHNLLALSKQFKRPNSSLHLTRTLYSGYYHSPTRAKASELGLSPLHIDCLKGTVTKEKLQRYHSLEACKKDRFGNTPLHLLTLFLPNSDDEHRKLNDCLTKIKVSPLIKNWNIKNNAGLFPLDLFSSYVKTNADITTQLRLSEWFSKCKDTPIGILGAPKLTRLTMEDITPLWRSVKTTTRTKMFTGTMVPIHHPRKLKVKPFAIHKRPVATPLNDGWSAGSFLSQCPLQGSLAMIRSNKVDAATITAIKDNNKCLPMGDETLRERIESKINALELDFLVEGLCFASRFNKAKTHSFTNALKSLLAWMVIIDDFNEESHELATSDEHYAYLQQILLGSTTINGNVVDVSDYGFKDDPMYTMLKSLIYQIDQHIPENLRQRYKDVFWNHIFASRKEKEIEHWTPPFSDDKLVELEALGIETVGIKVLYEIILAQSELDIGAHPYYELTMNQLAGLARHGNNIQSICKELQEDLNAPLLVDHLKFKIRTLMETGQTFSISFPVLFAHMSDSCLLYGIHQESLVYHQQLIQVDNDLPWLPNIYNDLTKEQKFALYSIVFWTTKHVPEWTARLARYKVVANEGTPTILSS